ncbi:MAG: aldolase/citrate lyase family protein [Oscillospiraceae bacterium]|nr:aldolase/citrate lyase family protein [Oscillospiraceae bacterium]
MKAQMPSMAGMEAFRAALGSPGGVFGPFMTTTDPAFVEAAGYAGYDFVLLDMEHGPGSFQELQDLIRAADAAGVLPMVRVPRGDDRWIGRALDAGAGGLLIPGIGTAQQAREAVAAVKFAPGGSRGTCRFARSACYGAVPGDTYVAGAQEAVVMLQLEGGRAIENLDAILEVPGIDVLFVEPYDLSGALGLIGQLDHPKVTTCIHGVIRCAAEKGIRTGCSADSVAAARELRAMGAGFIGYSCDTAIFRNAAAADVEAFHRVD